jgi:hypothetical protein
MAGIMTPPTPAQVTRFADALDDSWRVIAPVDPEFAAVQRFYAIAIRRGLALASVPAPAPEPPSVSGKPSRQSRHQQVQIAQAWYFRRQEAFEGSTPPSESQDVRDARIEIPGVARAVIQRLRPVEWKIKRGEKPKSPNS